MGIALVDEGRVQNFYSAGMSFLEIRVAFPELLVCGPSEVNKVFGTDFSEYMLALPLHAISDYLRKLQTDFGGRMPAVGIFLTVKKSLEELVTDYGDSFDYRKISSSVLSQNFAKKPMEISAIIVSLESNPVFRKKNHEDQIWESYRRGEELLSATESVYALLMADLVFGKRFKNSVIDKTGTVCQMASSRKIVGNRMLPACKDFIIGVGEFGEDNDTGGGIRFNATQGGPLANEGAFSGIRRKIR